MYREVVTSDGSVTFVNELVDESYHSLSGAEEEARKKYAELVSNYLISKDELVVFDVCFGLGYNSAALLDEVSNKKFRILCFENDKGILGKVPFLSPGFESFYLVKGFVNKFLANEQINVSFGNVNFFMFFGDFKQRILDVKIFADYVFFDPFSPAKVPELWSEQVFKDLFNRMNPGALLFTYSCARVVRNNLLSAGFEVFDGPIIGRRSPSTIAKKPIM